jgi:hypothetical protein
VGYAWCLYCWFAFRALLQPGWQKIAKATTFRVGFFVPLLVVQWDKSGHWQYVRWKNVNGGIVASIPALTPLAGILPLPGKSAAQRITIFENFHGILDVLRFRSGRLLDIQFYYLRDINSPLSKTNCGRSRCFRHFPILETAKKKNVFSGDSTGFDTGRLAVALFPLKTFLF